MGGSRAQGREVTTSSGQSRSQRQLWPKTYTKNKEKVHNSAQVEEPHKGNANGDEDEDKYKGKARIVRLVLIFLQILA